jgi:hypothetical protein
MTPTARSLAFLRRNGWLPSVVETWRTTMGQSKTSATKLRAIRRACRALELRLSGKNYVTIAAELGMSVQHAHRLLTKWIGRYTARCEELVTQVRAIELERLDRLLEGIWQKATTGDTGAVETALKISQRRSKLAGLDQPIKHQVEQETVVQIVVKEQIVTTRAEVEALRVAEKPQSAALP